MTRRAHLVLLLGVLLIGLLLTAGGTPAAADPVPNALGIRLVDAPVDARDDPRAAVAVVDDLTPGAVIDRRVEVSNGTDTTMTVALYVTGADIADGSFAGRDAGDTAEITTWTSIDRTTLTLGPGASAQPVVHIAVPVDAAGGERYGVVWAETETGVTAGGVVQKSRVGVRLYLAVDSGNPPPTAFTVTDLTAARGTDGVPTVTARVDNTGGRAIDVDGTLTLTGGPGGSSAGPFPGSVVRTIAPGQAGTVSFVLSAGLPDGPWTATVSLTSGLVTASASAVVTFPDSGVAAPVAAQPADGPGPLDTVLPVAGGVLFAALVIGSVVVARHRRRTAVRLQQTAG